MKKILEIKNLCVSRQKKEILKGVTLTIDAGEIHSIMGPNGSGKSTLALTLMGHPACKVTGGSMLFDGQNLTQIPVHERSQAGIFLAFQNPFEVEGVSLREFLYQSYKAKFQADQKPSVITFETLLVEKLKLLYIKPEFVERHLNVGFSGGEKKRAEILQLALLQPKLAILDEIDSGLDIDALKIVCNCLTTLKKDNPTMALIIITHYPRILHYLTPSVIHVMKDGSIIQSGTKELAAKIEADGYKL